VSGKPASDNPWFCQHDGNTFWVRYRRQDSSSWQSTLPQPWARDQSYSVTLDGLDPATNYVWEWVVQSQDGGVIEYSDPNPFTTDGAPTTTTTVATTTNATTTSATTTVSTTSGSTTTVATTTAGTTTAVTTTTKPGPILPRRSLTPGVTNPAVTQATIRSTICLSGWTKTVRPPASYTNALKLRQMKQYDETGSPSAYEEDYLIPLELGGASKNPKNLWPEPRVQSTHSDPLEKALKRKVCEGDLKLAAARKQILVFKRTHG
jgi:hypothetical protein